MSLDKIHVLKTISSHSGGRPSIHDTLDWYGILVSYPQVSQTRMTRQTRNRAFECAEGFSRRCRPKLHEVCEVTGSHDYGVELHAASIRARLTACGSAAPKASAAAAG
jgi:hypothetical protein